jgi:hypothetical protein
MANLKLKNNVYATIASAVLVGDLTVTLATGQGARFPTLAAGNYCYATLITSANLLEIVKVTSIAGDVLTVVRAQDGTVAIALAANDRVEMRPAVAILMDMQVGDATQTFAVANGTSASHAAAIGQVVSSGADGTAANVVTLTANTTLTAALHSGKVINLGPLVTALGVPVTGGFNCQIYGGASAVTLTPAAGTMLLPDQTAPAMFVIPAGATQGGVFLNSNGVNVGCRSFITFVPSVNNTAAASDITLSIGQTAYVDAVAALSMPLHIATADKQVYEIFISGTYTYAAAAATPTMLLMNNIAYALSHQIRQLYGTGTTVGGSAVSSIDDGFRLEVGGASIYSAVCHVFTTTANKRTITNCGNTNSTAGYISLAEVESQDTTTPWTSLGTITMPNAWTGRIVVRRVA